MPDYEGLLDNATFQSPLRIPDMETTVVQAPDDGQPDPPFVEAWPGSPEMEFRDDGSSVTRTFLVPWDSYFEAVRSILGYPTVKNGYISRNLPLPYSELEASSDGGDYPRPFLYATAIRNVEGNGAPLDGVFYSQANVSRYEVARIQVVFETLTYEVKADGEIDSDAAGKPDEACWQRYVTVVTQPQASYLTLPQGSFVWAGYGDAVPGSPGKVVPEFDVTVTWHQVPLAAIGLKSVNKFMTTASGPIDDALGKVNLYDMMWGQQTTTWPASDQASIRFRKGTMLLAAVNVKPIRSAIGERLFDAEFRFKYLPVKSRDTQTVDGGAQYAYGHNLLYWADVDGTKQGGYYEVVGKYGGTTSNYRKAAPADGKNIYDYYDMAKLFRVPA